MNFHIGLKRLYVVLAVLWGVSWPIASISANGMPTDSWHVFFIVASILSAPLIYFALVGLTKVAMWVIAGFNSDPL